ncbi:hypothetical protein BC941DRAFT_439240 [Chlamydoabsidia padenii]|nr:hypothetical protein BC941DRAFT_439240 [Chlamydoabsidia padenii]
MTFFNTGIDSLTPTAIDASPKLDQGTIADYCHTITDGGSSCNAYYQTRSSNKDYDHHHEIYLTYADTLEAIFAKSLAFDSNSQLSLVQALQLALCQQDDEDYFGKTFMNNYDAPLQNILGRLLQTKNAPLESSRQMKRLAFGLLISVIGACRPLESLSWVMENLCDLDWSAHPNGQECVDVAITFVSTVECYGISVLENLDPKMVDEYASPLLTHCIQASSYIDNILKMTSPQDQAGDIPSTVAALAITDTILDLVSFCYKASSETPALLSTANFLLVHLFDKFVLNVDLGLSHIYYERFHSAYTVKGPRGIHTTSSPDYSSKEIIDRVDRCVGLATQNGVTFDKLLTIKQHHGFEKATKESSLNSTLSNDGIMSILALSIYERHLNKTTTNYHLLSMLIEPEWIGRYCLGMIMNLVKNPQERSRIDKALLILLYMADNVDDGKLKVTRDMLDKEFGGLMDDYDQKMTLTRAFQIMTSITSMVDDPKLRFIGHQLIARFIQLGTDDTRLFILTELVDNCPFPTMHTAAIGLLKDQIDHSFHQLQHTPPYDRSVFCTKLLLDNFFPIIYENQVSIDDQDHSGFWDKWSYHMQALNLYYYLIMRDQAENHGCGTIATGNG